MAASTPCSTTWRRSASSGRGRTATARRSVPRGAERNEHGSSAWPRCSTSRCSSRARINVRYLTGLASSNAAVLVEPDGDATLFTDFRYAQRASALDVRFEQTAAGGDRRPRDAARRPRSASRRTCSRSRRTRRSAAGGVEPVPSSGLVERLRAVKEPAEIETLRAAGAITDAVVRRARGGALRRPDRARARLARSRALPRARLLGALLRHRSSPRRRTVRARTPRYRDVPIPATRSSTIDAGCRVDGYASDCTRTFATGELPDELARAYEVCLEAQLAGLEAIGPGVSGRDGDAGSRDVIAAAGWGEQFGHGLGHGLGLEVHEAPALRPESTDDARAGNVVSCRAGDLPAGRRRRADRGPRRRHRRRRASGYDRSERSSSTVRLVR